MYLLFFFKQNTMSDDGEIYLWSMHCSMDLLSISLPFKVEIPPSIDSVYYFTQGNRMFLRTSPV